MRRREFLSLWAGAAAARAAARTEGRVLVVLQLAGGNDGLNTLLPFEDDAWGRARPTLRVGAERALRIAPGLGFHPVMSGFHRLFGEGRLSVVQGVGYPRMNRDHNGAMRIWQTARPEDRAADAGWIGRAADLADAESGAVPAVYVGRPPQPFTVRAGQAVVPTLGSAADWTLRGGAASLSQGGAGLLAFASHVETGARSDAAAVAQALARPAAEYPAGGLAQSLRSVAQLVRASLGIRIFLVEHGGVSPGGYDHHSNQAVNHPVLLRELSDAVAAFCDDLARDRLLGRVLLATYSEFGRTLSENGRHGTGHGAAAPVFLAGGGLKGGIAGAQPGLSDLDADAPRPHTDFRSVYATALEGWLGIGSEAILGGRFPALDVLA